MTALPHLTVLDLTRLLPGASATLTLASFGARVIKIEQPGLGDYARHGFGIEGVNPLFLATNCNKQSMVLDLKEEEGKTILRRMAERADVLIESFRPGVMDRLGLGYEALRKINPLLIYVALTGYGQSGEYAQMAGHDLNYLAMAGVLDQIGTPQRPVIPGVQLADLAGGSMQIVIGTLLALEARHRSRRGQFVDVSMMDGVTALLPIPLSSFESTGRLPERGNELLSGRYACYNLYATSDERWVSVAALERKFWLALCNELGHPELAGDQFAPEPRQAEVKAILGSIFVTDTATNWFDRLGSKDCCLAPVRTLAEVCADTHFEARPIGLGLQLSETPAAFTKAAPALGEHTAAILNELGYAADETEKLRQAGVIE